MRAGKSRRLVHAMRYNVRVRKPFLLLVLLLPGAQARAKPKLDQSGTQTVDVSFVRRGAKSLSIRLLRPEKIGTKPMPVVLYFHGGAWKNGSHQKLTPVLVALARSGIAVASVEFRSSDEAHFPAQLADARAAVRWVKQNARFYSLSAFQVGAYGVSTGAQLAGLLAYSGSSTRAACLQSAPCDLASLGQGSRVPWNDAGSPLGAYLGFAPASNAPALARASPIFYADEDAPPTLILAGRDDEFIPSRQSEALYQKLKKSGARVQFTQFEGEGHDLKGVQDEVTRAVVAFFTRELK